MALQTPLPLAMLALSLLFSSTSSTEIPLGVASSSFPSSSSWEDTIRSLNSQDESRLLYLGSLVSNKATSVPIAPGRQLLQTTTYILRASFGTPPQPLLLSMDTSSDAAWIPCSPCVGCSSSHPSFVPSTSTTYHPVPCSSPSCSQLPSPSSCRSPTSSGCSFNLTYGAATIHATLVKDSLTLSPGKATVPSYAFGCVNRVAGGAVPPQGLLALGRGPLSLLSQTKSMYASTFSYCLPSFKSSNFSGSLRLGSAGQPRRIKTTPLLFNPHRPSLYYVHMTGVRVGRREVGIPPEALSFDTATGAGTVFDSGTMFTRLAPPVYAAVRDAVRRRMRKAGTVASLGGFDTCYDGAKVPWPTVTLNFAGGMNVTLPVENVVIHSTAGSVSCLAMAAAPDNVNSVVNVIANMQQQNHRVLFDAPNGRLGVAREPCTA